MEALKRVADGPAPGPSLAHPVRRTLGEPGQLVQQKALIVIGRVLATVLGLALVWETRQVLMREVVAALFA